MFHILVPHHSVPGKASASVCSVCNCPTTPQATQYPVFSFWHHSVCKIVEKREHSARDAGWKQDIFLRDDMTVGDTYYVSQWSSEFLTSKNKSNSREKNLALHNLCSSSTNALKTRRTSKQCKYKNSVSPHRTHYVFITKVNRLSR